MKVLLPITLVMTFLTVAAFLFMLYMMQAGSGLGTIGVMPFMIAVLPTSICVMLTAGLWMFQRNRAPSDSVSVLKQKSEERN